MQCLLVYVTLFTLVGSQAWDVPDDYYLEEDDVCQDNGVEEWRCRKARECSTAASYLRGGGLLTSCSWDKTSSQPVVCCPASSSGRIAKSISEAKCQEYKDEMCYETLNDLDPGQRVMGRPPPLLLHKATPVNISDEDWWASDSETDNSTDTPSSRVTVYGGEPAWAGEHPHMARIGYREPDSITWQCGGSLISERFVLSAAHCAEPEDYGKARWALLGALDLKDTSAVSTSVQQRFEIVELFVHKDYKAPAVYNDIVLFRLDREVVFTWFVAPACLFSGLGDPLGTAVATGWGRNESAGPTIPLLQKVSLPFVPPDECKRKVGVDSEKLPEGLHSPSQICAGEYQKDTCKGDSGGPLIMAVKDGCLARQVGITSFGPVRCGVTDTPGAYIRVAHFLPWIESIVWPTAL